MPRHVGSSRPTDGSSAEICSSAAAVIRFSQADDPHRTGSYGRSRTTSLPRTAIRRRCSSPSGWARWRWPATRTGPRHGRLSRGGSSSWNLRALPQALPSCILAAWLTRTPLGRGVRLVTIWVGLPAWLAFAAMVLTGIFTGNVPNKSLMLTAFGVVGATSALQMVFVARAYWRMDIYPAGAARRGRPYVITVASRSGAPPTSWPDKARS